MRFKILKSGGYGAGGIGSNGGVVNGPLVLPGDPVNPLEASTKQYVDNALSNISASNLSSGTIPVSALPSFTGDVINTTGSNLMTLSSTGISAGTYVKVGVDSKGRVTNGYTLSETDLPGIDWVKVSAGKPTTLAGYGITDGIDATGGTLTGKLTVSSSPVNNLDIVNKVYVDSVISSIGDALNAGDVVRKITSVTPTGYLRCNGAQVSKTTYSALYSVVGDAFSFTTQLGSGKPWRQQYAFNKTQTSDITGWTTGTSLPGTVGYSQAIVTSSRVYLLGGSNSSTVYTAPFSGGLNDYSPCTTR